MKDLLTFLAALAALMAAIATFMGFILSPDVTTYQQKLANKGVAVDRALVIARNHQRRSRILFQAVPALAAVILCIWALFVQAPAK